ncbi:MAG: primosomal protein, partial [Thermoproteota archaeon]|nr:primosomal protein [Thermoproteota archaeon]
MREVNRYNENFVEKGRALGELGHPDGPTVNLDRVSHKIVSLKEDGNNFIGKAKILSTPMGKIASSLLDEGVKLGVSSRGVGSLKESSNGCKMVGEDFQLATAADIVADPSAPDAFVNGIMEGKEWIWEGGTLREQLAEKTEKRINTLVTQKRLEEKKLSLFQDFLNNL